MTRLEPSLRQQLLTAQRDLRRQIEILEAGPASLAKGGGFIDNTNLIAEPSGQLREIEEGLANLGPDED